MKKQLIAVGLAGVLMVPSVAFAEAELYGSFRTGLEFTSGGGAGDAQVTDGSSRFGIRGSNELSEGLTASYRFETKFDSAAASILGGGRIGSVSLSGGFGTLSLGQMWTATGIHYGFVVDPSQNYGVFGGANYRKANTISYSSSVGAVGFQIDRHTDGNGTATTEFGATTAAGPVTVGLAHWSTEDYDNDMDDTKDTPKMSFTGFVVSAGLAGMNLAVGVGSTDSGASDEKTTMKIDESQTDVSTVTVTGSIADSGVSYALQMADSDMVQDDDDTTMGDAGAIDPSQTMINLSSDLGGGASLVFEHVARKGDAADNTWVGLRVNF